jgi:hypothetical protein
MRPHASTVQEVNIEMPVSVYDGFVDRCDDQASREYSILKNGLIHRRENGDHYERVIEIRCDLEDANHLLSLATKIYPDAIVDISRGITTSIKPLPA